MSVKPRRRVAVAAMALLGGVLAVFAPSTAEASSAVPAVFTFGEGNGRVALILSPTETSEAGQGALAAHHASWMCSFNVTQMIREFGSYTGDLCVTALRTCSEQALAKGQSAGITFAYDEAGKRNTYSCWSVAYGSELLTDAEQMLAQWQQPSPTEELGLYNPLVDLRIEHPVSVKSVLEYQDPSGAAARTWLFYDWWVGPQTRRLTFRDWSGKPRVAWRRGDQFISYNYAFAPEQPYFLNPDICLRAGLCMTTSYLPIVAPNGTKLLAKIQ